MKKPALTAVALTVMLRAVPPLGAANAVEQADFYVAPSGSDEGSGTVDAPFASLARARDAVRAMVASGPHKDVLVLIGGGTYAQTQALVFGPQDSGSEDRSITYAARSGEKVVLSGGRKITGWKKGDGEIWTAELSDVKAGNWYFRQLFVNGRRAVRARTPNSSEANPRWWTIAASSAADAPPPGDATITLSLDHPIQAWKNASDVELVFIDNNEGTRRRLGDVDAAKQTLTIPPPQESIPAIFQGDWRLSVPTAGKPCFLENAREMLDEPGEWYLDRRTGVLSYWPRPGEDMKRAEVVAPLVPKTLLVVAGTAEHPVTNVHFSGIDVEHVDWPLPPAGYYGMFGCLLLTAGDKPIFKWMDAAVTFENARSCSFVHGGIAHVGGMGLCLLKGTSGILIEGNEISDLGGGGIAAGALRNRSTLKWCPPPEAGDFKDYRIVNNHVHDCGLDYFGGVGILFAMTQDSLVAHNLIHDTAYAGIVICGNEDPSVPFARNNTVEFNHLYHVQKMAVDGGGIYASFPQFGWGAAIRGNLIHDIVYNPFARRGIGGWSAPGIYMDGAPNGLGCKNYLLDGNVVYRVHTPLFLLGGKPDDITYANNTFQATGLPPRAVLEAIQSKAGLEGVYRGELIPAPPH